ncbi:MAG: universal stress protein, partial [Vulcanimicrobiaceae bacterium]
LRVLGGDPSDAIAACVADVGADLIVIGSHGRSGLPRLFLGSVAEGVLRKSPVPVLVIREAPAPSSDKPAKSGAATAP